MICCVKNDPAKFLGAQVNWAYIFDVVFNGCCTMRFFFFFLSVLFYFSFFFFTFFLVSFPTKYSGNLQKKVSLKSGTVNVCNTEHETIFHLITCHFTSQY